MRWEVLQAYVEGLFQRAGCTVKYQNWSSRPDWTETVSTRVQTEKVIFDCFEAQA
jgi:hypothetical protein